MPYKDKEKNRECQKRWQQEHKEEIKLRKHELWHTWLSHSKEYLREKRARRKTEVLSHYCLETKICCAYCGVEDLDLLCLDHVNNDGYRHRQTLSGSHKNGRNMYDLVRQEGYPEGYQVLCWNCNAKKEANRRRGVT